MELIAKILGWIGTGVFAVAVFVAAMLLLRVIVSWSTRNPFAWLPYHLRRLTEPLVLPLRSQIGRMELKHDLMPLIAAVLVFAIGSFISYVLVSSADLISKLTNTILFGRLTGRYLTYWLILLVGLLYETAIFLRFFLPWFGIGYNNALLRFLYKMTEPLLRPIRRLLGQWLVRGYFDFTPLLALFLVQFLKPVIAGLFA